VKKTKLGEALIDGLESANKWHKGQITLRTHEVSLPDAPKTLTAKEIQNIRKNKLKMSQAVLAHFLTVSDKTIKAWEQGDSSPKGPALILLQLAKKNPELFISVRTEIINKNAG